MPQPGWIELHRHIDISVRHSTLYALAQERGLVAQSTSFASFLEKHVLRSTMENLSTTLASFTLYQQVLDRYEVIERAAFEAAEDAYREGIRKIEFRFSPSFVCELSKMSWTEALDGFFDGLRRAENLYPDLKTGLICIASRDLGPEVASQTVEFFERERSRFIGFDLAGDESLYPNSLFIRAIKPLVDAQTPITIHAGEGAGAGSVWSAIEELGARRIGHGIRSVEDPKLMETLRERKILLEMSPTSNRITNTWSDLRNHPFKTCLDFGVPVCLNTDDPSIFGNTLADEVRIAREVMGVSQAGIERSFQDAESASFL